MRKNHKIAKAVSQAVIEYLTSKNAVGSLDLIIEYLQKALGSKKAIVYTPRKLRSSEKERIKGIVGKLVGFKVKNFTFQTDEALIDGFKVVVEDKVWDFSLSGQLKTLMKDSL